jgi:hypothetical protein
MNAEKKIVVYDDYNSKIYDLGGRIIGTITTNFGNPAPRHGMKIIEIYEVIHYSGDEGQKPR